MSSFHVAWMAALLAVMVLGCASVPPRELVERNDHGGLAVWYEQEALRLHAKAEEMRRMIEEYAKPSFRLSPKENRADLIAHCQFFIESYTKAAVEAEALARLHRKQLETSP